LLNSCPQGRGRPNLCLKQFELKKLKNQVAGEKFMAPKGVIGFDSDELMALVKLDIEKGEIEKALLKIKEILADKNPPVEAYAIAARTYAQLGLFERAKDNFKAYLKANPEATIEAFQLGMVHFDSGENEAALSMWDAILKKEPVHPPALFYRGLLLAQTGKLADAKQSLDTLLKSAAVDNLYFGRAKELLQAINAGQAQKGDNGSEPDSLLKVLPKDAYKIEH
jgi:tetratricopeptide (TPR) repeat protein